MSAAQTHIESLPRSIQLMLLLGLLALAAFPLVGSDFYVAMVNRMMILAIFAMSLDLLQGVTGLVSLGHAAYFGLAGYALAFISPETGPVNLWWSLPLSVAASGLAALVIGFFVVRTQVIAGLPSVEGAFTLFYNSLAEWQTFREPTFARNLR